MRGLLPFDFEVEVTSGRICASIKGGLLGCSALEDYVNAQWMVS